MYNQRAQSSGLQMKGGKGSRLESLKEKMINVDSFDTRFQDTNR